VTKLKSLGDSGIKEGKEREGSTPGGRAAFSGFLARDEGEVSTLKIS